MSGSLRLGRSETILSNKTIKFLNKDVMTKSHGKIPWQGLATFCREYPKARKDGDDPFGKAFSAIGQKVIIRCQGCNWQHFSVGILRLGRLETILSGKGILERILKVGKIRFLDKSCQTRCYGAMA